MSSEDFIDLHTSGGLSNGNEYQELHISVSESREADCQPSSSQAKEDIPNRENSGQFDGDSENQDGQHLPTMDLDKNLINDEPILQGNIEFPASSTTMLKETMNGAKSEVDSGNLSPVTLHDLTVSNHKINDNSVSGVKRARMTCVDEQPSVHVIYNSLTRDSKKKLKEFLQQWSDWHAQHSSSNDSPKEALEYGEETFFPALHVGLKKASSVSFWMDNEARQEQNKEFIPLEFDSVPIYDRGYVGLTSHDGSANSERGIETWEASRCFNCGSYNHSLKECPKPRDNVAVNNARKQHNSKRNPTAGPRCPTRYYQNTPGGKFDGLRAGALGSETRQCLGIGELDPPPWLHRMRQIGYPPGYLDVDGQDQPSGITIFADEETEEDQEDGEIFEIGKQELQEKKKTVEFPGINAPIPENADHRRWEASPQLSGSDSFKNRSHPRSNRSSEVSRGHYRDQRWPRDYRDEGPPGTDLGVSPSMSSYVQRYGGYDSNYSGECHGPRDPNPIPRSPNLSRSLSDRGRTSPLIHEGSPGHGPHSSMPFSSPSLTRHSPQNYGSASFEHRFHDGHHRPGPGLSTQRKDRNDHHHHHRN